MGNKVGRNDPCPCGSGKKYKKCHLEIGAKLLVKNNNPLSNFNRAFLLKNISALSVLPENHGKNIRLDELTKEAIRFGNTEEGIEDFEEFKKHIEQAYDHNPLEDAPINLFTEIITFYGGDYLILSGISEGGVFILSHLLNAIFQTENNIPKEVKAIIHDSTLLLLGISNELLVSAELKRYTEGIFETNAIQFFEIDYYNKLEKMLFISNEELKTISKKYYTRPNVIDLFVIKDSDDFSNEDPDANPIIPRPFLKQQDGYFFLSPSNMHVALTHFIIETSIHYNCLNILLESYSDIIWHNSKVHLDLCGFKQIKNFVFPKKTLNEIKDTLFRFDTDKIAYVDFHYDNGKDYNIESPYLSQYMSFNNEIIDTYSNEIFKQIKEQYPNDKILHINLFAGIGRQYGRAFNKIEGVLAVSFSANDFDLIMKSRGYNPLMIWNYVNAKEDFLQTTEITPFTSELDLYSVYKKHDDSFYLNDEKKPTMIFFEPGMSSKFVSEIILKEDIHSIYGIEGDKLYAAPSVRTPWSKQVYTPLSKIGVELVYIIEGYQQPIWVKFKGDIHEIVSNKRKIYIEFLEAITYWIWQIHESAKLHIDLLNKQPITIYFDLIEREKFETLSFDLTRKDGLEEDFQLKVFHNTIEVYIPEKINAYLYGSDNLGERILVKTILNGFKKLQEIENGSLTLTNEIIANILERHVPLGVKKKIFLINTQNDLRLDPRGLPRTRYIESYNTNKLLDSHVEHLEEKGIISGEVERITDKTKFIRGFVGKVLLPQLKEALTEIDTNILLSYLISLNEKLIHKRRVTLLNTPTRIACFVSTEEQIKSLYDSLNDIDKVALSVRCLIEHIAACPGTGIRKPSNSEIDDLLAIMDQIISWGMLGDQVNFELFDVDVEILPSKRIGSDKIISKEVFEPFRMSKAKEDLVDAIKDFESKFIEKEVNPNKKIPINLDAAFEEDFGITLTKMLEFSHALTHIGFEIAPGGAKLSEAELFSEVKKLLPELIIQDFQGLLAYFSLQARGDVTKIPEGFSSYDISPWRYNRGLSLLRKPLVEVVNPNNGEKYFYWGPRQIMVSSLQILYLYYSGKLRTKEGGKLNSLIGDELNSKGSKFTNEVYNYLQGKFSALIIDKEVLINPKSYFKAEIDIGDVDVLIIDKERKVITLIECKKTEVAKNIKQIVEEVGNLFGSESKMGWIDKHKRRYDWFTQNINLVEQKYKLELSDFKIIPIVLTSEDLSTKYLKKELLPFKMATYYELEEYGLDCFL